MAKGTPAVDRGPRKTSFFLLYDRIIRTKSLSNMAIKRVRFHTHLHKAALKKPAAADQILAKPWAIVTLHPRA
jgi:hypothetical protein